LALHTPQEYVGFAERALIELVRAEGAVLVREAEAKISEARWPSVPTPVNPHHVTTARQRLLRRGWLELSSPIDASGTQFMHPSDQRGKKEMIRSAVKRKKRLHVRMQKWARATTRYPSGLMGEAGERVVRASLTDAAPHGTRPVNPGGGEVSSLLGEPVRGGPLDSAAWAEQLDEHGRSTGSVLCPIEVKNIRHWIYPPHYELFQLLHKAALLQAAHPDVPICPVLITRMRSWSTDQMSRDLGFRIVDVHKQFVLPTEEVDETHVEEVRQELGYADLTRSDTADPNLTNLLAGSIRTTSRPNAERWGEHGSKLSDHYEILRSTSLSQGERDAAMNTLREAADERGSHTRPW
jgi:hypothetical protein